MDAVLGRKVLNHVESHRELFDMTVFGHDKPDCGTVACLAGHAMLQSGYTFRMVEGLYFRPDGTPVRRGDQEARELLKMTHVEYYGSGDESVLFFEHDEDIAIDRFRVLVEAAEDAAAKPGDPGPSCGCGHLERHHYGRPSLQGNRQCTTDGCRCADYQEAVS